MTEPAAATHEHESVDRHGRRLIAAILEGAAIGAPGVATPLLEHARHLRDRVAARDGTWGIASFPPAPATPLGTWYDELPIDAVPRRPDAAPSDALCASLRDLEAAWPVAPWETMQALLGDTFARTDETDRRHRLWAALALMSVDPAPWARQDLYEAGRSVHEDALVRCLVLTLAYVDLPWPAAEDYLYDCTHDTDEPVFLIAFRICGRRADERAMDHLRPIVRSPAAVLHELSRNRMHYPVGHAAGSICSAQFAILGTDNPQLAAEREAHLAVRARRPLSVPVELARDRLTHAIETFVPPGPPEGEPGDLDRMIEIPAGPFTFGVDESDLAPDEWFEWSTCHPRRTVELPGYFIDRYPVTNAEYDDWCDRVDALGPDERRSFEHPGQRIGKPHRRNTRGDERYGPDHPVVGIDWFDAWAYARFHAKRLPSEHEWEKAARGPDGRLYPWGDRFDPAAVRYAGETYGRDPGDLVDWMRLLTACTAEWPPTTTSSVRAHPAGEGPYGTHDMCGNCWEYTTTAFFTDKEVRPAFADFDPVELMGSREGHVVIRGGAWSSPAGLVSAAYRGYDLLTDRHSEIGFRCAYSPRGKEEDDG